MAKTKETTGNNGHVQPGDRVLVMEALGYFIGTVVEMTPFQLKLGEDAVWVRDLGPMRDAIRTGKVNECHPLPYVCIKDHAIRYVAPWSHATPK